MKRSSLVTLLLLGATAAFSPMPSLVYGQDKKEIEAMSKQRDAMYKERLDKISRSDLPADQKSAEYDKVYSEWLKGKRETTGLVGEIDRVSAEVARSKAYRPPTFWDKVGDTALGVVGEMLKTAIRDWMNNPTAANKRRMDELTAERDRLLNERNNPNPGGDGGLGRPVYDENGNVVGWDRDGDGRPDLTDSNRDGRPDTFNGGTNDTAYADPYEYLAGSGAGAATDDGPIASTASANEGLGGGARDAGGGGGFSGGGGGGGAEEPAKDEEAKKAEEELAAAEGGEGTPTGEKGTPGSHPKTEKDKNGDGIDDARGQLTMHLARVIVMPKDDPAAAGAKGGVAGNRMPTGPIEDDWNDMEGNNGDAADEWGEEWGNEWGDEPTTTAEQPAPGAPGAPGSLPGASTPAARMGSASEAAKVVDQLIRVETVIAEWRKKAKEEAEGKTDPYGFTDAKGYRGGGTTKSSQDPLASLRLRNGKLDFTRCEIWLVERDSWQEGKEPRRFRVTVGEDAIDSFDPIHGGYVVVRGIVTDLIVDPRVIQEIRGEVKALEVVQVILSQEDPPEAVIPNGMAGTTGERGSSSGKTPLPPLDEGDDSGW